jgi:hypothetical protein
MGRGTWWGGGGGGGRGGGAIGACAPHFFKSEKSALFSSKDSVKVISNIIETPYFPKNLFGS